MPFLFAKNIEGFVYVVFVWHIDNYCTEGTPYQTLDINNNNAYHLCYAIKLIDVIKN
jgi:hypothetical protein